MEIDAHLVATFFHCDALVYGSLVDSGKVVVEEMRPEHRAARPRVDREVERWEAERAAGVGCGEKHVERPHARPARRVRRDAALALGVVMRAEGLGRAVAHEAERLAIFGRQIDNLEHLLLEVAQRRILPARAAVDGQATHRGAIAG